MNSRITETGQKMPLRNVLRMWLVVIIAFLVVGQGTAGFFIFHNALQKQALGRISALTREFSRAVRLSLLSGDRSAVDEHLKRLLQDPQLTVAAVWDEQGKLIAGKSNGKRRFDSNYEAEILGKKEMEKPTLYFQADVVSLNHDENSEDFSDFLDDTLLDLEDEEDDNETKPVNDAGRNAKKEVVVKSLTKETQKDAVVDKDANIDEKKSVAALGRVAVGLDLRPVRAYLWQYVLLCFLLCAIALLLGFAFLDVAFRGIFHRVEAMREHSARLAEGDLTTTVLDGVDDEIGGVAKSIEMVRSQWVGLVKQIRSLANLVLKGSQEMQTLAVKASSRSDSQLAAVEKTLEFSSSIVSRSRVTGERVAAMQALFDNSQNALQSSRKGTEAVRQELNNMSSSLQNSNDQVHDLTKSVKDISVALQNLSPAIDLSNQSTKAVQESVSTTEKGARGIAKHARDAQERSSEVLMLLDAQQSAVHNVQSRMSETQLTATNMNTALTSVLAATDVIFEVSDLTALLSLNAAIIAAQAGEHGRGFSIIADGIKQLSDRTRVSTVEIQDAMNDAQAQIDRMQRNISSLNNDVEHSLHATEETSSVVQVILEEMGQVLNEVQDIVTMTESSHQRSEAAGVAVERIRRQYGLIQHALAEQERAHGALASSFEKMQDVVEVVVERGQAQLNSTSEVLSGMGKLSEATDELAVHGVEQMHSAEEIEREIAELKSAAEDQQEQVKAIASALDDLQGKGDALGNAVGIFRL